jgi:hypothetical protein
VRHSDVVDVLRAAADLLLTGRNFKSPVSDAGESLCDGNNQYLEVVDALSAAGIDTNAALHAGSDWDRAFGMLEAAATLEDVSDEDGERDAYWQEVRASLPPIGGPS